MTAEEAALIEVTESRSNNTRVMTRAAVREAWQTLVSHSVYSDILLEMSY